MNELLILLNNKDLLYVFLPISSILPASADKLMGQRQHLGSPYTTEYGRKILGRQDAYLFLAGFVVGESLMMGTMDVAIGVAF